MKQILFVDDDLMVLQAMKRALHNMRGEWNMRFAAGGSEALQYLAEAPADIVVSDMRMPLMNGAELLNRITEQYPSTTRIILSGFADSEMIMQCVAGTHQFVSKPCDGETLRGIIRRTLELDGWLNNENLKTLIAGLASVPSLPSLYFKILKQLESQESTLDQIGETIAQDASMTAKILQLANSAFFGLRRELTSPTEAVIQLGLDTIKSLVLGIHVFSRFESVEVAGYSIESLWHHSLATAATARKLAQLERQEKLVVEESFTAGMLHDLGRLILLANLPAKFCEAVAKAKDLGIPLADAERSVFGASHAEVGAYLLGIWGLPISLVEATAFHHYPGRCPTRTFAPLTAVHVANVLEQHAMVDQNPALLPQLDQIYLLELGLWNRVPIWQRIASQTNHLDP